MAVSQPSDKSYALRPEDLAWRLRRGLRNNIVTGFSKSAHRISAELKRSQDFKIVVTIFCSVTPTFVSEGEPPPRPSL